MIITRAFGKFVAVGCVGKSGNEDWEHGDGVGQGQVTGDKKVPQDVDSVTPVRDSRIFGVVKRSVSRRGYIWSGNGDSQQTADGRQVRKGGGSVEQIIIKRSQGHQSGLWDGRYGLQLTKDVSE